jgi:hypothetical protein
VIPPAVRTHLNHVHPELAVLECHVGNFARRLDPSCVLPQIVPENVRHMPQRPLVTHRTGSFCCLTVMLGGPKQVRVRLEVLLKEIPHEGAACAHGLQNPAFGQGMVDDLTGARRLGNGLRGPAGPFAPCWFHGRVPHDAGSTRGGGTSASRHLTRVRA